jgi:hypothetical protein
MSKRKLVPRDPVMQEALDVSRAACDSLEIRLRNLNLELTVLRDENEQHWLPKETEIIKIGSKRDSIRLRRNSVRGILSFKASRPETPREKLQDLSVSSQLRGQLRSTIQNNGTAVELWLELEKHRICLRLLNRGVESTVKLPVDKADWTMVEMWSRYRGIPNEKTRKESS